MPQADVQSHSLRALLLWILIPAQVVLLSIALWHSSYQLHNQIDLAYDRSLLGALRAIDHNIATDSGGLAVELPYLMLEFFELAADNAVYYRILTEDGLADIGSQELPLPDQPLQSNVPVFYDQDYLGTPIRIAAMARDMNPPLYGLTHGRIIVMVGEDRSGRDSAIRGIMLRSIARDALEVLASSGLIFLGVLIGLRPLTRLYNKLKNRQIDDLSPILAPELPREIQPLVQAVNQHVARHARQARQQQQFLDDASHQLRTPLAILNTQLDYALREADPAEARTALLAMRQGLIQAQRTAAQMLALARARESSPQTDTLQPVALAPLAQDVIRQLYSLARQKHQTIALDGAEPAISVPGIEWLLREAILNLLDNAIKYTPIGGTITLHIAQEPERTLFSIQDTGPGMSKADIRKAGLRFRRGQAGKHSHGAGLGLAIVRTIMQRHRGTLSIHPLKQGCKITLVFPSSAPPAAMI
ncbi:sensor histidine kinase [Castellaniella sp.]|uniref:sensor histidine kinase n=1 Tax=Castellaniella sp. TaxID=1955812 RepID=UPI002AFFB464|nr:sensor histidine kinase [Castellaniella sp.]